MEEAYSELYQQFLQLRSLCQKQAALLHHLAKALQEQKRHDDPSVEIPEHLQEKPGPSSRNLTAPVGFSKNMEMFSELLSMDLSKLSVDEGHQINESQDFVNVPPLQSLETFWCPGGSGDNRPTFSARMPATNMADILSSQADGMLMSDVALQSHICDFCQAVFPGDTGTRGDFLRHLYTHIT